jgi:Kef-type K+ transport system membrane component KefB
LASATPPLDRRIGLAGAMAGWLFIGSLALLGVSGFLWLLIAIGLIASSIAYGIVLLVTQSRAAKPRQELATGLVLFAAAGVTAIFAVATGLPHTESWWMPAHWILGLGLGAATIASGLPSSEVR